MFQSSKKSVMLVPSKSMDPVWPGRGITAWIRRLENDGVTQPVLMLDSNIIVDRVPGVSGIARLDYVDCLNC